MIDSFSSRDFERQDEASDEQFYNEPRMVVHIDEYALAAITDLIRRYVPAHSRILDLMSSFRSHLPSEVSYQEVVGLGMNADEMQHNPQLTSFLQQDLNQNPRLLFEDQSFDAVLNTVSVQYLTHPVEVFREVARILRPSGVFIVSFSDRMFPTKAVRVWYEGGDEDHIELIKRYFTQAGEFGSVIVEHYVDENATWYRRRHDPLFAVIGMRQNENTKL